MTIPKVGCSTIKRTLQAFEGYGVTPLNRLNDVHHGANGIHLGAYPANVSRLILESPHIFKFVMVRNPYERLYSAWKSKIASGDPDYEILRRELKKKYRVEEVSFSVLVEAMAAKASPFFEQDAHFMPQTTIALPHLVEYDFVGKMERFGIDFGHILDVIDAPNEVRCIGAQRTNATKPGGYSYNSWSASQVERLFAKDFEVFHYDPDDWR